MSHCNVVDQMRREEGFTYLWLLFLVAFMGLGLTVAAAIDSTVLQREREKELLSIGRQFRVAIERYYETHLPGSNREYPASLDNLLQDNRVPGIRRHLRRVFVDPMTGKAEWGLVSVGGRIVGVHSLSEKMPIKQDGFEAEDIDFRGKQKYADWAFVYPFDLMSKLEGADNSESDGIGSPYVNDSSREERVE